jgi:hypothetical protein
MIYSVIADLLVGLHFVFILFVILGGVLVVHRTWVALLHLPCLVWGVMIEWQGWICPLTPLELHYRELAGDAGYSGGFIEHYLMPLVYPASLTRTLQIVLGSSLLALNLLIYGYLIFSRFNHRQG